MVVDAKVGITHLDQEVLKLLHKAKKKLLIAVNKIDDSFQENLLHNFYPLGKEYLMPVSAVSGYNIAELLEALFENFSWEEKKPSHSSDSITRSSEENQDDAQEEIDEEENPSLEGFSEEILEGDHQDEVDFFEQDGIPEDFKEQFAFSPKIKEKKSSSEEKIPNIAIVGRANVGKSTLLNYLLKEKRAVVSPIPGTTRDHIDADLLFEDKKYHLIDTAGIRKKHKEHTVVEKFASIRTQEAIKRADLCLFLSDVTEGMTAQDKKILSWIQKEGKSCVLLFNKWDLVKGFRKEHCLRALREEAPFFQHCPTLFVSALEKKGFQNLFSSIERVLSEREKKISTGQLNRFIQGCILKNHPPMILGKRLRIYYLTQVKTAPPGFIFFVNNPTFLADTYKKFLHNQFRKVFGFAGTPIRFFIKGKASLEK
jgi:ribosome-associated GTPase EngA